MVDINSSVQVLPLVWDSLKNMSGASSLIKIGQAVGIVVLVYIIFLIIRAITDILASLRFKKMNRNISEINKKMDLILEVLGKKSKAGAKKK
jgi:hypothetical protein